jgi:enamine deaminase RidA (YjgF/YER057c/UK114 family)
MWSVADSPRATGAAGAVAVVLSAGAALDGALSVDDVVSLEVLLQDANDTPRRTTDKTR